jgi:hypothetical protein
MNVDFVDDVTFATAYYDIGIGNDSLWSGFTRSTDLYFQYFENVKTINCNLVIYCSEKHLQKMKDCTKDRTNTKIVVREFTDLDFYVKFFEPVKTLMASAEYRSRVVANSPTPQVPEYNHPEYNIVNFNKIAFVVEAMNHFSSSYYGWIDFGFGYSKPYVKYTIDKDYGRRVTKDSKVFMRCFRVPQQQQLFNPSEYWHNNPSIQGSSFIETEESIVKMYSLIENSIDTSIKMGCIDDDQTQYAMSYLLDPTNFNIVDGNWFTHFYE